MERIFFATFESNNGHQTGMHDRMQIYRGDSPIQDFFDWVQEQRRDIESKRNVPTTITSVSIIQ